MRRFKTLAILLLALGVLTALLGMSYAADPKQVYKARLSYHWGPTHYSSLMGEKFAKLVREETDGQVDIAVFGNGTLFPLKETITALAKGAIEFGGITENILVGIDPNFAIESLWYFLKPEHVRTLWTETEAGKRAWAEMERKTNAKRLAWVPIGPTCFFTTDKPLNRLEDFFGRDVRYPSKSEVPTYKALKMNYVSLSTEEVYAAFERKMINSSATAPSAIKGYGWWDYAKHATLPYLGYWEAFIGVNADWWNRLPDDLKTKVLKAGNKISEETKKDIISMNNGYLDEIVKIKGGSVNVLPQSEVERIQEHLFKNGAYDEVRKTASPDLWDAAVELSGMKFYKK